MLASLSAVAFTNSYEPFSYSAGAALDGQGSWYLTGTTSMGTIEAGNLDVSGLAGSGGNRYTWPSGNDSVRVPLDPVTNGAVYFSFALRIDQIGSFTGHDTFTGLTLGTATTYFPKIDAVCNSSNAYQLGIYKNSGTNFGSVASPTFTTNDTVFVVARYTFNTGSSSDDTCDLWLNPSAATFGAGTAPTPTLAAIGAGAADIAGLDRLTWRGTSTSAQKKTVDELRLGSTWASVTPTQSSVSSNPPLTAALGIQLNGRNVLISWPTNLAGLSLTSATQLLAPIWTPVTPVLPQGTNNTVTVPALLPQQVFQLKASYESTYESADNWNFPNDNYWVCGVLKNATAPTRYSDGSLVNGGVGYNVDTNHSTCECGSGWVRFDLHELIPFFDGVKTNWLAFHKGGQGYSSPQLPYGHLLLDDVAILDGALDCSSTKDVPHRGDPGAGLAQVQGQPPEYGAPSWVSSTGQWDSTHRNGRGGSPVDPTRYAVKVVPHGATNELPADWQYKPNVTSSRYNKYADDGPEFGDGTAHYALLTWSWLMKGDGVTTSGGGGMVRALLRDGQEFYRCPVKAINGVAYGYNSNQVVGEVTAIYVKTRASGAGPWLYGWMISAHRAKLPDGSFGPTIDHISSP
ncbi:MAG TPA: hypothetical protein VLT36_23790 [Candidatus Dormibacteraeota bacterium]|nr:hypothetical protein [Candidatus Dormibacteraeota bacterium]